MKKGPWLVLIFLALAFAACTPSTSNSAIVSIPPVPTEYAGKTNPLGPDAAASGLKVYQTNGVPCHGETGHGEGPAGQALDPKPRNLAEFQSKVGDDYLYWRISTGVDGTAMVSWRGALTDEQIWQVIAYIRTLKP